MGNINELILLCIENILLLFIYPVLVLYNSCCTFFFLIIIYNILPDNIQQICNVIHYNIVYLYLYFIDLLVLFTLGIYGVNKRGAIYII